MLNIDIVHGNLDDSLDFEVNGNPSNGHNYAKRNWAVNWKVRPGMDCNVHYIHSIKMKSVAPNVDIFPNGMPAPQGGSHNTHWMGKVKSDAPIGAQYIYEIQWVEKGSTNIRTWDPIISINPSTTFYDITKVVLFAVTALLAFLTLQFLRKNKKFKYPF